VIVEKAGSMSDKVGLRNDHRPPEEPARMHDAIGKSRAQQQRRVRAQVGNSDAYAFFNLLTGPELFDKVESLLPAHRERLFPPTETLSMFLAQALSQDRSCQKAVNEVAIKRLGAGRAVCSTHTGGYCAARMRLPIGMVDTLTRYVGQSVTARTPDAWHWRGHRVRLADGTTLRLPDTPANQPSRLPATAQPETRAGLPAVSDGGAGVPGQWGGARCRDRPLSGQGRR